MTNHKSLKISFVERFYYYIRTLTSEIIVKFTDSECEYCIPAANLCSVAKGFTPVTPALSGLHTTVAPSSRLTSVAVTSTRRPGQCGGENALAAVVFTRRLDVLFSVPPNRTLVAFQREAAFALLSRRTALPFADCPAVLRRRRLHEKQRLMDVSVKCKALPVLMCVRNYDKCRACKSFCFHFLSNVTVGLLKVQ